MAPAFTCSSSTSGKEALPLPKIPMFTGNSSDDCRNFSIFQIPGVQVVALVPVAGPVPPPISVVTPDEIASSAC